MADGVKATQDTRRRVTGVQSQKVDAPQVSKAQLLGVVSSVRGLREGAHAALGLVRECYGAADELSRLLLSIDGSTKITIALAEARLRSVVAAAKATGPSTSTRSTSRRRRAARGEDGHSQIVTPMAVDNSAPTGGANVVSGTLTRAQKHRRARKAAAARATGVSAMATQEASLVVPAPRSPGALGDDWADEIGDRSLSVGRTLVARRSSSRSPPPRSAPSGSAAISSSNVPSTHLRRQSAGLVLEALQAGPSAASNAIFVDGIPDVATFDLPG